MNKELKMELLEALHYGRQAQSNLAMIYTQNGKDQEWIDEALTNRNFTQRAIAKLENEPVDEIKREEQGK